MERTGAPEWVLGLDSREAGFWQGAFRQLDEQRGGEG